MENEEVEPQESDVETRTFTLAHLSVAFAVAACVCMAVAVMTDTILLFFPLFLLGVAGVASGVVHLRQSQAFGGFAVFGIVVSGLWAFLGGAFSFIVIMMDSHL